MVLPLARVSVQVIGSCRLSSFSDELELAIDDSGAKPDLVRSGVEGHSPNGLGFLLLVIGHQEAVEGRPAGLPGLGGLPLPVAVLGPLPARQEPVVGRLGALLLGRVELVLPTPGAPLSLFVPY